ncbi:hypothetical protein GCM10020256_70610 [Streptomyces thermocoprophilus]
MSAAGSPAADDGGPPRGAVRPTGLLDVLNVASVVLGADGRVVLWSPQAEELFGWTAQEALGKFAARIMVHEQHVDLVVKLFADVMETGQSWAGAFPVRHKNGSTRLVEFRNMRLLDARGDVYALGLAADASMLHRVERDVALSTRLVAQSPMGLAVLDTDLRYVSVNAALERINGVPAEDHVGRTVREVLPDMDAEALESALRQVLETGLPLLDQPAVGRTPADPDEEHAWSVSLYRLEDTAGTVIGVAASVADITDQYRASVEAEAARRRLALIADASTRIGTTLELERTAHELADVAVPELADVAAVDLLEAVVKGRVSTFGPAEGAMIRALAVQAEADPEALDAADPPGRIARYGPDRLVTECVRTGRPVMIAHVRPEDLPRIARSPEAAELLARAGVHSYLAVPLIARGEVLGALDLKRTHNALPFGRDDLLLARELAARAAVQIDNARWYQSARNAALTLQRSLLPSHPPVTGGLEVASRYQPAGAASEVGGDWFDVIPLDGGKTALVVGGRDGQRHRRRRRDGPPAHGHEHAGLARPRPGGAHGAPRPDHRRPRRGHRDLRVRRARPEAGPVRHRQRRSSATRPGARRVPARAAGGALGGAAGRGRRGVLHDDRGHRARRPAGVLHRRPGRDAPALARRTPRHTADAAGRSRPAPGGALRSAAAHTAPPRQP